MRRQDAADLRRVAAAAVAVASVLLVLKLWAWWASGSAALLASWTDSALDIVASGVNALAIRHALTPADRGHRFGHGKVESLAGLGQALLVAVTSIVVLRQSWEALRHPQPLAQGTLAVAVMVVSMLATVALLRAQRRVAATTGSRAIAADALHYQGDVLQNAGVLLAVVASASFGWHGADGVVGLLVGVWMLRGALDIGGGAVGDLLDAEADDATRAAIVAVVQADPLVRGVHDLRSRRSGPEIHATLHVQLDGELTLRAAHRIAAAAERRLLAHFGGGHFSLHVDPDDHDVEDPFDDGPLEEALPVKATEAALRRDA